MRLKRTSMTTLISPINNNRNLVNNKKMLWVASTIMSWTMEVPRALITQMMKKCSMRMRLRPGMQICSRNYTKRFREKSRNKKKSIDNITIAMSFVNYLSIIY